MNKTGDGTMKKKTVYLFVFDGFADWEPSYALVGINKSEAYNIKTIAIDKSPTKSMGGISIFPDLDFFPDTDLKDIDSSNTAMLILPGGAAWEEKTNQSVAPLVIHCVEQGIPVAAICGATIFLADLGVLDATDHTSNDLGYLQAFSSQYQGDTFYQYRPAVTGRQLITASGTAAIGFAEAIFEMLGITHLEPVKSWFQYFQNKTVNFSSDVVVG
jgi:putative intracellular protease/amidase